MLGRILDRVRDSMSAKVEEDIRRGCALPDPPAPEPRPSAKSRIAEIAEREGMDEAEVARMVLDGEWEGLPGLAPEDAQSLLREAEDAQPPKPSGILAALEGATDAMEKGLHAAAENVEQVFAPRM